MAKKVLIFAPFGNWIVHTQLDCVLGAALQNRGCEVRVLGCDGLFETCLAKGNPPEETRCQECQKTGAEWFARFGLPVTQMRSLLHEDDRRRARAWADGIDLNHLGEEEFDGHSVGRWMVWATHSALRLGQLDFTDPVVATRARDLAFHGAQIAIAVPRMLLDYPAEIAICYSGSNSYYRVFCEIARKAGLKGLVHERGSTEGAFFVGSLAPTYEMMAKVPNGWDAWKDVPLSAQQLQRVVEFFEGRTENRNTNFLAVHNFRSEADRVRQRLRLPPGKKVVLALASGDWEFGMFASFGGLHVLWPTQFEWLQETVRMCAEKGWALIIRQHPLGAGRGSYPRASAFLAEMLRQHSTLPGDARAIMPAENLSTYDLFHVADVVVHQFSRAGAEAYVRGVPALCVTGSSMAHMGIPVVHDRADYGPALERAMAQAPCIGVESLRSALRYGHFRFFILGSAVFKSVAVKNVYEADYRFDSAADLMPGADPRLDEICDHLLKNAPLYPLPDSAVPLEEETRFVEDYRARLVANRKALADTYMGNKEPAVTVLRFCTGLPSGEIPPVPSNWRSRHQNVQHQWLRADAGGGMDGLAYVLGGTANDLDSPYLYFLPEKVRLDESAISQTIDLLEQPENAEKDGALMGCYSLNDLGELGPEWHTHNVSPRHDDLPLAAIPALNRPLSVLGLVLWRRERLHSWLDEMVKAIGDHDETWCRTMLASLLDDQRFVQLNEPLVILEAVPSRSQILAEAAQIAATDVEAALRIAADDAKVHGLSGGLRTQMARWLIGAKQHARALPLITAAFKAGEGSREGWDELVRALPETMAGKRHFDDFWPAIQTVHGYMVPGQEKFLHQKVRSLPENARILEIGSCHGRSTTAMAFACLGTRRHILCVDTFCGNEGIMTIVSRFKHLFRGNLRRHGLEPYVSTQCGYSHPVVRALPEEEMFDFAFIDASHEYADVLLDFELVYPRIKPGGWIAFHDVAPGWPGSWRVWEQTGKPLLEAHEVCDTLTCGRKRAGVPWNSHEQDWPGYLLALIRQWRAENLYLPQMEALEAVINGNRNTTTEGVLMEAPDRVVESLHWMARKETHTDPWVHYTAALVQWQRNPTEAQQHLAEAHRMGLNLTPLAA